MAISLSQTRYEFELTVKKYRTPEPNFDVIGRIRPGELVNDDEILLENLNYKSLSGAEVIRKLLDYINI